MNRKVMMSVLVILMATAAVAGATMAWFTDTATVEPNTFVAGTLKIRANEVFNWADQTRPNWNPGDCDQKEITLEVTGTKSVYLRARITETWTMVGASTVTYTRRNAPNITWKVNGQPWNHDGAWQLITIDGVDYWFYKGPVDAKLASGAQLLVLSEVCLDGAATGNDYQGATYTLAISFEAVQTTNQAVNDVWGYKFEGGSWVPR